MALQSFNERAALGHGSDDDSSVVCNYEQVTGAKLAEFDSDGSIFSPMQSPPRGENPVILIVGKEWAKRLCQADSGRQLRMIRQEDADIFSTLKDIAENTIVGVMETNIEEICSRYPGLDIFDYQVTRSQDYESLQVVTTTEV